MPFFDHYPYTNFHNVNLDWVLQAVKSWGTLVEQNNIAFHNLEEANENFKEYVTTYLENLDLQEEINTKINELMASGVFGQYLSPYVHTEVTEWLEDNITPTTPAVDASLSISGAAADAKATGDAIANVENTLRDQLVSGQMRNTLFNLFKCVAYDGDSNYLEAINNFKNIWRVPSPAVVFQGDHDSMLYFMGLSNTYNTSYGEYRIYNPQRFCYCNDDIRTIAGNTYRFTVVDYIADLQINVRIYQADIDTVIENHSALQIIDSIDWTTLSDVNGVVSLTATNSSVIMFQFKLTTNANTPATGQYFTSLRIEELQND